MKRKQNLLTPCLALLVIVAFSMLCIGCIEKEDKTGPAEKAETKHLRDVNSTDKDASQDATVSQTAPVNDQIQIEQWRHFLDEIRDAVGEMEEIKDQVMQTNEIRLEQIKEIK